MRGVYTLAIRTYALGVKLAALFGNTKARQWVEGRKAFPVAALGDDPWIWFHAASLGEFEQGRPLIEAIKASHPEIKICLSFFSPSGYEIRKSYPLADEVLYLPIDTPANAQQWVNRHHFIAAFFIKYEFWFNYMKAVADNGIPLFYISLILRPDQYFFKPLGRWFLKQLKAVTHFFVQDQTTFNLLNGSGYHNTTLCGDTRFDRVAAIARQAKRFPEVEAFLNGRACIVAGSTWPPDESLLIPYAQQLPATHVLIIAPHDISAKHLQQLTAKLDDYQLYTELNPNKKCKILVINTIGILSQLYQYADFAYIGGGFGVNIHNIQEPVTFGCPVVFGPRYTQFKEAVDLVRLGGAFTINGRDELSLIFDRLIQDPLFASKASETGKDYLASQLGATEAIMKGITSIFSA
ncbi:MAG: 3-deoxy-D-manno-octulosonic acid transferase [Bacteroidales bacterium]|nr:3-deoxy-D-manno-octulosonic acid transferase [Bacteroidales bacterium]